MKQLFSTILIMLIVFSAANVLGREEFIPPDRVLTDAELIEFLVISGPEMQPIEDAAANGDTVEALQLLAAYLKEQASDRFYFDWKKFRNRFQEYQDQYSGEKVGHYQQAELHRSLYPADTEWELPFKNLLGEDVTAYELRHLARQQKSDDNALVYYYSGEDTTYLNYWVRQMADLNEAFAADAYDDEGNGIYERYRAGRRMQNWLLAHHSYLASENYGWEEQLLFIRTALHHAAQMAERTEEFSYGNHHTKGLVGLFQIVTSFPDFRGMEQWQQQALSGLELHLQREVNDDGFQFERSVHYHKGDIDNYFWVYQLGKINNVNMSALFEKRIQALFDALVKIAQPNKRTPVLQDDTDRAYAENNKLGRIMTVGTILFEEPTYRYFCSGNIPADLYWFLREQQLTQVKAIQPKPPAMGSVALEETGYYVMRNGWADNSKQMVISAGISDQKPDHQHGEMMSLTAYANGYEILPNYQVHYDIPTYRYWKNSWVKNVALVDSIPLGRGWQGNEGGSGFGKWETLPNPTVNVWKADSSFDYFNGSHDSYDSRGINYSRDVLFLKDGFWVVQDNFTSNEPHEYQQIWQGHYTVEPPGKSLRSSLNNGHGLMILPVTDVDEVRFGGLHGKENAMYVSEGKMNYNQTTVLFPYESYRELRAIEKSGTKLTINDWVIQSNTNRESITGKNMNSDAETFVANQRGEYYLFNCSSLKMESQGFELNTTGTLYVRTVGDQWKITSLSEKPLTLKFSEAIRYKTDDAGNRTEKKRDVEIAPGNSALIQW